MSELDTIIIFSNAVEKVTLNNASAHWCDDTHLTVQWTNELTHRAVISAFRLDAVYSYHVYTGGLK